MVEKYVKLYMKRNYLLGLWFVAICLAPLLISDLVYGRTVGIQVGVVILFVVGMGVLVSYIPTSRFRKMIAEQEALYQTKFTDYGARRLEGVLYISEDWLIASGTCAVYKKHIRTVNEKYIGNRRWRGSYHVTLTTADQKRYVIVVQNKDNIKPIRKWRRRSVKEGLEVGNDPLF